MPSRIRRGLLAGAWLGSVALLLVLWGWQVQSLAIWGLVEGIPVPAASTRGGRVAQMLVAIGDRVEAGMPVAHLYDVDVRSRLASAETGLAAAEALSAAELAKLDGQLEATLEDNARRLRELDLQDLRDAQDLIDSQSRITVAQQEACMAQAGLEQELHASQAENGLVGTELERRLALTARGLVGQDSLMALRQRQALLTAVLEIGPRRSSVMHEAIRSLEDIRLLQGSLPARPAHEELVRSETRERALHREAREVMTRRFAAERIQREADVAALRSELQALTILSPVSGIVSAIVTPSGAVAAAGAPVVQVVLAPANKAIAWIGERQARFVTIGDRVQIQPSGLGRPTLAGRVIATGAAVDAVPGIVRLHFTSADRGLPVLVAIDGGDVVSGERVELRFGGAPWWAALPW